MKVITTIVIIGLSVIILLSLHHIRKLSRDNENYSSIIAEQNDSIRYHKSENGKIVASKLAAEVTAKQAMEAYREDLDKIRETFRIEAKNIRSYVKAEFAAYGTGTTIVRDTVFRDAGGNEITEHRFTLSDGYLSMAGRFRAKSDMFYEYSYSDSLQIISHFKKQGLFKQTKLFVDAAFQNPNNKITGLRNIQVSDFRDKRFGIGPFVGISISYPIKPVLGVCIQYSIFRF